MAIEIKPTTCEIDSNLGNLADSFDLALVEENSASPAMPVAQAWRTLNQGDLIKVRLGLNGLGFLDYGEFRVDECALEASESSWRTRIAGRDKAALLIEHRAYKGYGWGEWAELNPEYFTLPTAEAIAKLICERVGLKLIWDAPNYLLPSFVLQPDESASQAIGRLLEPLRQSHRYYADAWIESDTLVVRRRGNGPNVGTIDCSLGQVRSIHRAHQPQVGEIKVWGAVYVFLTIYGYAEQHYTIAGADGELDSWVHIREESPTHRIVETGLVQGDGSLVMVSREIEQQTYQEVFDEAGGWLGRVLLKTVVLEKLNLHKENPKIRRKVTCFGYDEQWNLVLRDEVTAEYREEQGGFVNRYRTLTRFEQITPTDVRTTTTEYRWRWDEKRGAYVWEVRSGFPKWEQSPGTLQSGLRQSPDPRAAWQENPDRSLPAMAKKSEVYSQYYGEANGGGDLPRVIRDENLLGDYLCQLIANDLVAESGKWLYTMNLFWPRPFSYRKGQKVILANLPGGCPDLVDAIITGVHTRYDGGAGEWTHEIEFEWWGDS